MFEFSCYKTYKTVKFIFLCLFVWSCSIISILDEQENFENTIVLYGTDYNFVAVNSSSQTQTITIRVSNNLFGKTININGEDEIISEKNKIEGKINLSHFRLKKFSFSLGTKKTFLNIQENTNIIRYGSSLITTNSVIKLNTIIKRYDFQTKEYTINKEENFSVCDVGYDYYLLYSIPDKENNYITTSDIERLKKICSNFTSFHMKFISNYGYETGGEINGDGGIDNDQHVFICLVNLKVTENNMFSSIYIAGFYDPFQDMTYSEAKEYEPDWIDKGYFPSEKQIIFLTTDALRNLSDVGILSTLLHEYQHLAGVNISRRKFNAIVPVFLTEGASMLIEEIINQTNIIQQRLVSFLNNTPDNIFDFDNNTDPTLDYATAYVFFTFYNRNTGGKLLKEIIGLDHVNNINNPLDDIFSYFNKEKNSFPKTKEEAVRIWGKANIIDKKNEYLKGYVEYTNTVYNVVIKGIELKNIYRDIFNITKGINFYTVWDKKSFTLPPYSTFYFRIGSFFPGEKVYLFVSKNVEIFYQRK